MKFFMRHINQALIKFQSPEPDFVVVTIPEGYTLYQIASKLEEANLLKKESVMGKGLEDIGADNIVMGNNSVLHELEGYLFPDTYYFPLHAADGEIIKIMFNQFQKVFSQNYRDCADEVGFSINEIMTIASLIEREAALYPENNNYLYYVLGEGGHIFSRTYEEHLAT